MHAKRASGGFWLSRRLLRQTKVVAIGAKRPHLWPVRDLVRGRRHRPGGVLILSLPLAGTVDTSEASIGVGVLQNTIEVKRFPQTLPHPTVAPRRPPSPRFAGEGSGDKGEG
jgi:hypothetical protein